MLLRLTDAGLFDLESVAQISQGFVVARIDVELFAWHLQFDCVPFAAHGGTKIDMDDIVTFGAPCDVVSVTESVHLQRAYVRRKEGKVLRGRGKHVPRVEVEERHEEVDSDCGASRDNKVREDVIAEVE